MWCATCGVGVCVRAQCTNEHEYTILKCEGQKNEKGEYDSNFKISKVMSTTPKKSAVTTNSHSCTRVLLSVLCAISILNVR